MVKRLRRTKKNQKYNYNKNRKRLNKRLKNTGTSKCPEINEALDKRRNLTTNIRQMGLAFDVNKAIPVPNAKRERLQIAKYVNGFLEEDITEKPRKKPSEEKRSKVHVRQQLEKQANEYVESRFRLPKGQVKTITDFIDAHGFNYKAMARDRKNYYQETWRQLRQKVRKFLSIPVQCTPYLEQKGWLDCDMSDPNDARWKEYCTDDEEC
ncbi:nucleolar protein 16 [Topomyia yanbarensis]|uniref:nucleolar protein 16 n=1 Tax=Topomyia yanbarensis TaxID=2498891 RepID=UPI00273BD9B5|nr:nucleolar protein 16 [Topomyia yanbarensis]